VPVRVDLLQPGFSPRLEGENPDHIRVLAEVESSVPPILVHWPSMRIIDGMHRFLAARRRGTDTILVEFFDGTDDDAFLLALKRNAKHGYPLTSADREQAVKHILETHPNRSDRVIAEATGISTKTVGAIRRRRFGENGSTASRLGRDGRVRPLDPSGGRLRASQLIQERPMAPLREIASKAGISVSTAQDVRQRLRTGQSPLPSRHRSVSDAAVSEPPAVDRAALLASLKRDPSLRLTEAGRHLLRLLEVNSLLVNGQREQLVDTIPQHWLDAVSDLADEYANYWHRLALQLRRRAT
jgi:uncharacterized protein YerC